MTKLKRWYAYAPPLNGLLMTSSLSLATVWYARFYQAEPAPVVGTTKCPGPLCLMWRYLHQGNVHRFLQGHYSSVIALTDPFAKPVGLSSPLVIHLVQGILAGCYQPLLPPGSSRRYFCESVP